MTTTTSTTQVAVRPISLEQPQRVPFLRPRFTVVEHGSTVAGIVDLPACTLSVAYECDDVLESEARREMLERARGLDALDGFLGASVIETRVKAASLWQAGRLLGVPLDAGSEVTVRVEIGRDGRRWVVVVGCSRGRSVDAHFVQSDSFAIKDAADSACVLAHVVGA
jgi:hypothetical protein